MSASPACAQTVTSPRSAYTGARVALLTQHGKQALLRDVLQDTLGCTLVHTDSFDTDTLGTFTRETSREGSQMKAARQKAQLGMKLTGASLGLASEGAFGLDPFTGMMAWDNELLLWADPTRHLEVSAWAHGPAQSAHRLVRTPDELMAFAAQAQFPSHHLVLRPAHQDHPHILKGISDPEALHAAFRQALALSDNGAVFAENDLRAHANPTRQALIRKAGLELARKLASSCPDCGTPGFWIHDRKPGMPCRDCGEPTRLPLAEVWQCPGCQLTQERALGSTTLADPSTCDLCNP